MKRSMVFLCLLLSSGVHAQNDSPLKASLEWLASQLPDSTEYRFEKTKIAFAGCRHRDYSLMFIQPLSDRVDLEAGVTYAKGVLNWGVYSQRLSATTLQITPRFRVNENLSVGVGWEKQQAPRFQAGVSTDVRLPSSERVSVTSRWLLDNQAHQVDVEISRQRWQASAATGSWFERGDVDTRVTLSYQRLF
ncbi:hypothetical protein LJ739_14295 [Aestuariibacter halophilus]|uniref:Outer membrane protein beta-barrel domain-containing protein n=1 Tax=Fluctibacter halophilus TaxID=226011 RepID=A0ABS8GAF4_9ALTE|nr:hypothetical protein [Aestuariibacter halophilus]MCC2617419.1 hypothetical protein [Aestuariibacter halophilus]